MLICAGINLCVAGVTAGGLFITAGALLLLVARVMFVRAASKA
jgi:hypothetical protein